ncbi:hypothetical protein AB6O49_16915 [Streptomyces sp. SBR177]
MTETSEPTGARPPGLATAPGGPPGGAPAEAAQAAQDAEAAAGASPTRVPG